MFKNFLFSPDIVSEMWPLLRPDVHREVAQERERLSKLQRQGHEEGHQVQTLTKP